MKKILLVIVATFLLVGCMDSKASDAVENYLNQYRNLSDNVITDLDEITADQNLSENQKGTYTDIMKKQYQDLQYEIVEEEYDGDKAIVTAKITVYDLYKVQQDADNYMNNNMEEFYDDNDVYDNDKYLEYKLKQMKDNTETVSYTITFNVVKEDNKWVVVQPDEETLEKIHGIYNYELEN